MRTVNERQVDQKCGTESAGVVPTISLPKSQWLQLDVRSNMLSTGTWYERHSFFSCFFPLSHVMNKDSGGCANSLFLYGNPQLFFCRRKIYRRQLST